MRPVSLLAMWAVAQVGCGAAPGGATGRGAGTEEVGGGGGGAAAGQGARGDGASAKPDKKKGRAASGKAAKPASPDKPDKKSGGAAADARGSSGKADKGSDLGRAIAVEVNRLRRDPRGYAATLRELRSHYNGRLIELPDQIPIRTFEGVAAVDEAIAAVRKTKPVRELAWSPGLAAAAAAHAADIGPRGSIEHQGRDGSWPHQRIARHGAASGLSGENLDFGFDDPEHVILHLMVDDGIPDRGHRKNLLTPEYTHIGVACGPHRDYGVVCVIDLAEGYVER